MDTAVIADNLPEFQGRVRDAIKDHRADGLDGHILVKQYPTKAATVATLKAHVGAVAAQLAWYPDLIVVDYADILGAPRRYDQRRDELARVYEDLRGLAGELEVPVWTASQANRRAFGRARVDMTFLADSWDKAKISDYIIGITRDKDAQDTGTVGWDAIKVRNAGSPGIVRLASDYSRTHVEDVGLAFAPD